MGRQSAVRFDLDSSESIREFRRRLQDLGRSERQIDNYIGRSLSRQSADRIVPLVQAAVRSSPVPQADAVAQTVRSKHDRMIVVVIGATNPPLSGMRRNKRNRMHRGSIAYGVALGGPGRITQQVAGGKVKGHRRNGTRVKAHQRSGFTRTQGNIYVFGRTGSEADPFGGYLRGWKDRIVDATADEYGKVIRRIFEETGLIA